MFATLSYSQSHVDKKDSFGHPNLTHNANLIFGIRDFFLRKILYTLRK